MQETHDNGIYAYVRFPNNVPGTVAATPSGTLGNHDELVSQEPYAYSFANHSETITPPFDFVSASSNNLSGPGDDAYEPVLPPFDHVYGFWLKGATLTNMCLARGKNALLLSMFFASWIVCVSLIMFSSPDVTILSCLHSSSSQTLEERAPDGSIGIAPSSSPIVLCKDMQRSAARVMVLLATCFVICMLFLFVRLTTTMLTYWPCQKWMTFHRLFQKHTWEDVFKYYVAAHSSHVVISELGQSEHVTLAELCQSRFMNTMLVFAQHERIPFSIGAYGMWMLQHGFPHLTFDEAFRQDVILFRKQQEQHTRCSTSEDIATTERNNEHCLLLHPTAVMFDATGNNNNPDFLPNDSVYFPPPTMSSGDEEDTSRLPKITHSLGKSGSHQQQHRSTTTDVNAHWRQHYEDHILEHTNLNIPRMKFLSLLLLILSPIIFCFALILFISKHAAKFRLQPANATRQVFRATVSGVLTLRLYNELTHEWKARLNSMAHDLSRLEALNTESHPTLLQTCYAIAKQCFQWIARSFIIPLWCSILLLSLYHWSQRSSTLASGAATGGKLSATQTAFGQDFLNMVNLLMPLFVAGLFMAHTPVSSSVIAITTTTTTKTTITGKRQRQAHQDGHVAAQLLSEISAKTHLSFDSIHHAHVTMAQFFQPKGIVLINDLLSIFRDPWIVWAWCRRQQGGSVTGVQNATSYSFEVLDRNDADDSKQTTLSLLEKLLERANDARKSSDGNVADYDIEGQHVPLPRTMHQTSLHSSTHQTSREGLLAQTKTATSILDTSLDTSSFRRRRHPSQQVDTLERPWPKYDRMNVSFITEHEEEAEEEDANSH